MTPSLASLATSGRPVLAYLTSAYARASDTFIRGEVRHLRALGFQVHTFSVRRTSSEEAVNEEVRREQVSTEYLLEGLTNSFLSTLRMVFRRPVRFLRTLVLAQRIAAPGARSRLWHLAYFVEANRLAERLVQLGVDHLHNHIGQNSAAVALLASSLADVPYSLTIHGPTEFDAPRQIALAEKVARARFVVTISAFSRSQLMRWSERRHWDKIHIVHCGVDATFLEHAAVPVPSTPRLVCTGRLVEQKGHLVLLEAARRLDDAGVPFELLIVGDGPLRAPLEERLRELRLTERVRITGWKNAEEVRALLLSSRALVLPSFAEGLPVSIMESLALGRPVITTYVGGIPELVAPGRGGWILPAGNPEELCEAMRKCLESEPEALATLAATGRERVASHHDQAAEVGKLAELFERYRPTRTGPSTSDLPRPARADASPSS